MEKMEMANENSTTAIPMEVESSHPPRQPLNNDGDWRSKLLPDSRYRIVSKTMEVLKKHPPFLHQEGLDDELKQTAVGFEETIYDSATSQAEYFKRVSEKLLNIGTKAQSREASSSEAFSVTSIVEPQLKDWLRCQSSVVAASQSAQPNITNWQEEVYQKINVMKDQYLPDICGQYHKVSVEQKQHDDLPQQLKTDLLLEMLDLRADPQGPPPPNKLDVGDWRHQLLQYRRSQIVSKMIETLNNHLGFSGVEGLNELKKIAVRFEEKIFRNACSQSDYLRKISLKMLTISTRGGNQVQSVPRNSTSAQTTRL